MKKNKNFIFKIQKDVHEILKIQKEIHEILQDEMEELIHLMTKFVKKYIKSTSEKDFLFFYSKIKKDFKN